MEASLTLLIECGSRSQQAFVKQMLKHSKARPQDEDNVTEEQLPWFEALEDIEYPDSVRSKGNTLYAVWTVGGADWDVDVKELYDIFKNCAVIDVYGIVAADDGWYELWVLKNEDISRYEDWIGESLEEMFDGVDDYFSVLKHIKRSL